MDDEVRIHVRMYDFREHVCARAKYMCMQYSHTLECLHTCTCIIRPLHIVSPPPPASTGLEAGLLFLCYCCHLNVVMACIGKPSQDGDLSGLVVIGN